MEYHVVFEELKDLKQNSTKENHVYLRQMDEILEKYGDRKGR